MLTTAPPKLEGRKKEVFGKFLSKSENTKSKVILISNFALLIIIMIYNEFTFSQVFSGFFGNHRENKKMARSAGVEPLHPLEITMHFACIWVQLVGRESIAERRGVPRRIEVKLFSRPGFDLRIRYSELRGT